MQQYKTLIIVLVLMIVIGVGYYIITMKKDPGEVKDLEPIKVQQVVDKTANKDDMPEKEMEVPVEENGDDTEKESDPAIDEENAKVFEVAGGNFYFSPNTFTVKEGDTVKVVFTNKEGTHDWVLDEFDARTKVSKTGEITEVVFVADKAGEYEFYCSIGQHRANGMVGTLIVQ